MKHQYITGQGERKNEIGTVIVTFSFVLVFSDVVKGEFNYEEIY